MAVSKIKGLQMWCARQVDGYRDVAVTDMTTSWKSGLAFCAIIHRYRPDLIDYDSLAKENVFENNDLAFSVAEKELGIPAFLEASDMVAIRVPDKLSIITYVSQYYNYFHDKPQLGGPGVKSAKVKAGGTKRHQDVDPKSAPESKRTTIREKSSNRGKSPDKKTEEKTRTMGDKCEMCDGKVYLLERHIENGKLYHRSCFRHSEMSPTSKVFQKSPFLSNTLTKKADKKQVTPVGRTQEPPASVSSARNLFEKDSKAGSKPSHTSTDTKASAVSERKVEEKTAKSEGLFGLKKAEEKNSSDVLSGMKRNKVQDAATDKDPKVGRSWFGEKSDPKKEVKPDEKKTGLGSGTGNTSKQSADHARTQPSSADKPPAKTESSEGFLSNLMKTFAPPKEENTKKPGLLEFLSSKKTDEEKKPEDKKEPSLVSAQIAKRDQTKPVQSLPADSASSAGKTERTVSPPETPKPTEASVPVPKPRHARSGDFSGQQKMEDSKFAVPAVPKAAPRSSLAVEGKTEKKSAVSRPKVLPTLSAASPRETPMEVDDDSAVSTPDSPPPLPASAPPPLLKVTTPREPASPRFPLSSPPDSGRSGRSSPSPPSSTSSVLSSSSQGRGHSDSSTDKDPSHSPPRSSRSDSKPASSARSSSPPKSNLFGRKSPTKSILADKSKNSGRSASPPKSKGIDSKSSSASGPEPITRPFKLELTSPREPHRAAGLSYTVQSQQETPMEVEEALAHALNPTPTSPPVAVLVTPQGEGEDKRVLGGLLQSLANIRQHSPRSQSTSSAADTAHKAPARVEDVVLRKPGEGAGKADKAPPRPKSVPNVLSDKAKMSVFSGGDSEPRKGESRAAKAQIGRSHDDLGSVASHSTSDVPEWKKALEDRKAKREMERKEEKMETESSGVGEKLNLKKEDMSKKPDSKPAESSGSGDGPSWIKDAEKLTNRLRHIGSISREKDKARSKSVEETEVKKPGVGTRKMEKMEVDDHKVEPKQKSKPVKTSDVKPVENGIKLDLSTAHLKKTVNGEQDSGIGRSEKPNHSIGSSKDTKDVNANNHTAQVNTIPETPLWKQGILEKRGQQKTVVQTSSAEEVPDWQKALEDRKARLQHSRSEDAITPKPVTIQEKHTSMEEPPSATSRSKPSSTGQPKSEVPAQGASSEAGKLEWQLEAERRMAALKTGFVDPEKAKLDKAAEKGSQDPSLSKETAHPPDTKKDDKHAVPVLDHAKPGHGKGPARPPPPESKTEHLEKSTHPGPARPPPPDTKKQRQLPSLEVVAEKQKRNGDVKPLITPAKLGSESETKEEVRKPRIKLDIFKPREPVTPRAEPDRVKPESNAETKPQAEVKGLRVNNAKEELTSTTTPVAKPRAKSRPESEQPAKSRTKWYTAENAESTESRATWYTSETAEHGGSSQPATSSAEAQSKQKVIPAKVESPPPTPPPRLRKIPLTIKFDFENSTDLESSGDVKSARDSHVPPEKPPRTMEYQGPLTPTMVDFSSPKAVSPLKIQQTLTDIDHRLTELEIRGRQLEDSIRNAEQNETEDDGLMVEWFKLVNEKNVLVRQEADLVYLSREQELLDEQEQVELQLQYLVGVPEEEMTQEMREEMEFLLVKKLQVINQRSCIVDSMDEDRLRYEQEDKEIDEMLTQKGFSNSPDGKVVKETKTGNDKKKKKK